MLSSRIALVFGAAVFGSVPDAEAQIHSPHGEQFVASLSTPAAASVAPGKYAVVVDLDVNRLFFRQGDTVLWSAPIGTGTGLVLRADAGEWDFSTPRGIFHVQHKAENPAWILPDWYFIENNLPIPPPNDPKRRQPGGLGAAAVYLGDEIAIHGTDKPELLGQRVSHGCIRLANEYALRLFHNVQVGTPVMIVGDPPRTRPEAQGATVPAASRRRSVPKPSRPEPLASMSTDELLARLGRLRAGGDVPGAAQWPHLASQLVRRGLKGDDAALGGLLALTASDEVERELHTFAVDAYSRGAMRVLTLLARLDAADRERVARSVVETTMALYHGSLDDVPAPWPTKRMPRHLLDEEAQQGWDALRQAEQAYRDRAMRTRVE